MTGHFASLRSESVAACVMKHTEGRLRWLSQECKAVAKMVRLWRRWAGAWFWRTHPYNLAGITNTVMFIIITVSAEGKNQEMLGHLGFDPRLHNEIDSHTPHRRPHPCNKRKDGAPSMGTVHAKIVKGRSRAVPSGPRINRR